MSRINRLSVIPVFFLLLLFCQKVFAEEALVISVIGQAWIRGSVSEAWNPLVRGAKIKNGQEIKFQEESLIRAVTEAGELRIVEENGSISFASVIDNANDGGMVSALSDFVSSGGRSRAAATRTIDSTQAEAAQQDWIRYIQNPPGLGEIEDFLSLIDYYESSGQSHRRWALLQKLSATSGNFVGFSQLNNSFDNLVEPKIDWQVVVNSGTTSIVAEDGGKVQEGDGIQINVESDQEVFVYVFFTTNPETGDIETYNLSPQSISLVENESGTWEFAGLLSPRDTLSLPNPNQSYRLDSNQGYEFIWGWACLGPIVYEDTITYALSRVQSNLASSSTDISATVEKWSPDQCPYSFSRPLEHL
jgi:hypothetical protein